MTDKHTMPDLIAVTVNNEMINYGEWTDKFYDPLATSYTLTDIHEATKAERDHLKGELKLACAMISKSQAELERVKQSHAELWGALENAINLADQMVVDKDDRQMWTQAIANAEKVVGNDN
jgi:hypothetical protein